MVTRRGFIKTGGVTLAVTGIASTVWLNTRTPLKAYEPWSQAGTSFGDPRLDALSYALLAPSPHNRQPWKVALRSENELSLFCDLERRLPETDPFDRQITIGLGCFLEALRMAAANIGYALDVERFPKGEPSSRLDARAVAAVRFKQAEVKKDPLFEQLLNRHTNRSHYDLEREVASATLVDLLAENMAQGSVDNKFRDGMREFTWSAMERELTTSRTMAESTKLMRIGKKEIIAKPDGLSMGGPMFELMNKVGMFSRESMADPNSIATTSGLDSIQGYMRTSMGYVWISTENNSRLSQLKAGEQWLRLHLKATELGLAMQPQSQALQEFAEMEEFHQSVHEVLGVDSSETVQMLGRIGYAENAGPSPRWPLETIFVNA
jgi:hypothetical protein